MTPSLHLLPLLLLLLLLASNKGVLGWTTTLAAAPRRPAASPSVHRRGKIVVRAASEQQCVGEAIGLFRSKYGSSTPTKLPDIFSKTVASENSIAGQDFYQGAKKKQPAAGAKPPLSERSDEELAAAFSTISELYGGDERALSMVKAAPVILSRERAMFGDTKAAFLRAFAEKYTETEVEGE